MTVPEKIRLTQWASCAGCAAKMDAGRLADVLARLPRSTDPDLLVGPETSDDAGVYRIADNLALLNTVDFFPPIVDDPYTYGQIAAANALSDIYAMGGRPVTALNLVAFPRNGLPLSVLHDILRGGSDKLAEAGVALVGGHTVADQEVKYGMAITGLIDPARLIRNGGAQPGDRLILAKPIGVGIITTALKQECAEAALVERAATVMRRLNRAEAEAMLLHDVHACTDITGYGLLGHALEMARASGVRLRIEHQKVPHFPEALDLCARGIRPSGLASNRQAFSESVRFDDAVPEVWRELLFDPQTSGGLLIALPEADAPRLLFRLCENDIEAFTIGHVTERGRGEILVV
ncbi:MAG: selenide, water dikinase SelD [Sulfuricaulis sp.]|uniref:selenide, water dikinase SelD n=1 Tax=Sulfuricaulis sp. TaxID=2003553 RepID=UPI0025FF9575|nr:selenide, water dikinase SelD [Sulfuricaulis sp.]MCR4347774.1 selenide, water dikinase SelD [Sulfuricaulis sp.]